MITLGLDRKVNMCDWSSLNKQVLRVFGFILIFYFLYQPFGNAIDWDLEAVLYRVIGLIGILAIFFGALTSIRYWSGKTGRPLKRYHFIIGMVASVTLASMFVMVFESLMNSGVMSFDWNSLLGNVTKIGLVAMIPIGFFSISRTIRASALKDHDQSFQLEDQRVLLKSTNDREILNLHVSDIYYISSLENYVKVHYQKEGVIHVEILRNTIQNIEKELSESSLIRCHRGTLVNLEKVYSINRDRQRLQLKLDGLNQPVTVSRSYTKEFKSRFQEYTSTMSGNLASA